MAATILVIGGYGTTGATLSELLLEHSAANVILAGRTPARAEALATTLRARYPGRVSARRADASDPGSLAVAFGGVDMVAVAASSLVHARTVMEAALHAGIDYFDLQMSAAGKLAALEDLRGQIERQGRCFITDGGIHPGLSAAMIRALAPAFASLERADVSGLLRADWTSYDFAQSTIHEFAAELADYRVEALADGRWSSLAWKDAMKTFDFGPPFGRSRCSLMFMEELRLLPEQIPSLRTCGFYISGFNPFTNSVMMPIGLPIMKYSPQLLGRPYARALTWSLRTFGRPPYGTVWQVEAEGRSADGAAEGRLADGAAEGRRAEGGVEGRLAAGSAGGTGSAGPAPDGAAARPAPGGAAPRPAPGGGPAGTATAGLRVTHPDGYWLTAAAAAACLLQYADGSLRAPGVHLQALVVEPARFLRDLRHMGCGLQGYGVRECDVLGVA